MYTENVVFTGTHSYYLISTNFLSLPPSHQDMQWDIQSQFQSQEQNWD